MSSRRRNSKKNLGTNLSDIQRRLRRMERKPIRTRLQNRVIKGAAIAPSSITADEVGFGTAVVSSDPENDVLNPKDGLLVINPDDNAAFVYSEDQGDYLEIKDANAQASADGKNTIYRQTTQPTGASYATGDTWFDSDDGNKIYRYDGTAWVAVQLGGNGLANINANSINTGTLNASLVTVSNLDAGSITTGTLSAITITGNTIQQGSSGNYIRMDQTDKATIKFFVTGYTYPGYISVESSFGGTLGQMSLQGPTTGSEPDPASIGLYGENMYLDAGYINIESTGNFSLGNSSSGIQIKYDITTSPSGPYIHSIRNIWQSLNSYTPDGSDGAQGDVWLTY
jgi:hypothetical protein